MVWLWYVIGAVLGALQLGLPIAQGKREVQMPVLFVAVGAALGALVYGSLLWGITSWLGIG
jgi:hypothetical protein